MAVLPLGASELKSGDVCLGHGICNQALRELECSNLTRQTYDWRRMERWARICCGHCLSGAASGGLVGYDFSPYAP